MIKRLVSSLTPWYSPNDGEAQDARIRAVTDRRQEVTNRASDIASRAERAAARLFTPDKVATA